MRHTACALFAVLAGTALAQPIDVLTHTPPRIYEGQVVVRVTADSARETQAALSLSESLWSEGAGVGAFDIQVRADRLGVLAEAGLNVEMLIPDLQAHADAAWARVQAAERAAPVGDGARGANPHDDAWFANYKQLFQIEAYVNNLGIARPDLASVAIIGQSLQGRDVRAVTITGPDQPGNAAADRPVVLWNGCQHAREWISPMTVTYIASRLVGDYDTNPRVRDLVDSVRFVIVPVVNPDGYEYSWTGERFWRKNRRPLGSDTGVDLNRNWGYEWGGDGSSGSPSSDIYRGASPFSEPETQNLRDLTLSFGDDLAAHIDYHSYSQLILWPFGFADNAVTPEPDRTFFDTLATDMSDLILSFSGEFYNPIQSWLLYPAAGTSTDWFYGTAGAKSMTVELRPSDQDVGGLAGFDPAPSEILPCAQENFEAALLFAERTTRPLGFSAAPPASLVAGSETDVVFSVTPGTADYAPGSVGAIVAVDGNAPANVPATPLGAGLFRVTLPAVDCGQTVSFSLTATTLGGVDITFPSSGPFDAEAITVAVEDTMETDTGWTVGVPSDTATTGIWNRMAPQATTAQPSTDHTPAGTDCWITDGNAGSSQGANDVDGGATTLTSPALDASAAGNEAVLVYWRWYANNTGSAPDADSMPVLISGDDGATWTTLETVTENAGAWVERRFRIADFVTPSDAVRVRFVARDEGSGSIVEAAVDDLRIEAGACAPPTLTADLAPPFGVFNFFDIAAYLGLYNSGDPAADYDANGQLNFFDLSTYLGLFNAGI
tara:strand:- start:6219 stop:8552 length:2334 start_codon:yes stop_codon:yes gene_type:complete